MGLIHALVAMELPGPGSVFTRQSWRFPKPVYIGDVLTAEGRVESVHRRRPMAEMTFVVTRQSGEEVVTGDATVYQVQAADRPGSSTVS